MQARSVYMASRTLITMHLLEGGGIAAPAGYNAVPVMQKSGPSGFDAQLPVWKRRLTSKPTNEHPSHVHNSYPAVHTDHLVGYFNALRAHNAGPCKLNCEPFGILLHRF